VQRCVGNILGAMREAERTEEGGEHIGSGERGREDSGGYLEWRERERGQRGEHIEREAVVVVVVVVVAVAVVVVVVVGGVVVVVVVLLLFVFVFCCCFYK